MSTLRSFRSGDGPKITVESDKTLSNKDIRDCLSTLLSSGVLKDPDPKLPDTVWLYYWGNNTIREVKVTGSDNRILVGNLRLNSYQDFIKVLDTDEFLQLEDSDTILGKLFIKTFSLARSKDALLTKVRNLIGHDYR